MPCNFYIIVNDVPKCKVPDLPYDWGVDHSPCCGHPTRELAEADAAIIRKHLRPETVVRVIEGKCLESL